MDTIGEGISRRTFLTSLAAGVAFTGAVATTASAQGGSLYVIKPGNLDRLRTDFNSNRERVRLLAILSPT